MRIQPIFSSSALIICLQLWSSSIQRVDGLKFTVKSWTGIVTNVPFPVTWNGGWSGTLTLSLENGTEKNQNLIGNIQSNINSNSWVWTPGDKAIPGQPYFLKVVDTAGTSALGSTFTVAATASSSSSSTTTSTTTSTTPNSTPTETTTSNSSSGLSTGAKAGIGVGSAAGAIAIISLLTFFILKRRKKSSRLSTTNGSEPYELENKMGSSEVKKHELSASETRSPVEMLGTVPARQEMEGSPGLRQEMSA